MNLTIGDWQLETVSGGDFSIDGGAAFGVVPKAVWQTIWPCDENNLVRFTCRCLLARNGRNTVLIDTGYGGKYPPLDRKAYLLEDGNPVLDGLVKRNVAPEEIDLVLFTHLHFDHAGGATVFDRQRRLVPTFPNAKYVAHEWEWEDALSGKAEFLAAYPQNNLIPLKEHGCVGTFRGNEEVLPGLTTIHTGGHTRGHTAFLFQDESHSEGALFIGDLCPTAEHMRLLWNMSYDMFLLETRRKKRQLLEQTADNNWWLLFAHDPRMTGGQIRKDPKKAFVVIS